MVNPAAPPSGNWETGEAVSHCDLRIEALIDELSGLGARVLVPTPALAEAMMASEGLEVVMEFMQKHAAFEPAPFDLKAAYELALMTKDDPNLDRRRGDQADPKQKVKFDRQIVATAKAYRAERLYTDDRGQTRFAHDAGLKVIHSWNLALPTKYAQHEMALKNHGDNPQS